MIPPLAESGVLPPGIHQATLSELENRFAQFNRSDRRPRLFQNLQRLLTEVRKIPFIEHVYLAGSFISAKPEPNDFDCLLIIDGDRFPNELRPFEYRILSRRAARKEFGGDVISVVDGTELHHRYLDFFQTTRDGHVVGLIELVQ